MTDCYDTTGNPEGRYQPGSDDQVLLNKLGITNPAEMDDIELDLLDQLSEAILDEVSEEKTHT